MESRRILDTILLKTAVALVLLSSAAAAAHETNLVQKVCRHTPVPYNDCVQALNSDFRTGTVKDLRELAFLSLDMAMANSSEAMGFIGGMIEYSSPALKPVLQSCSTLLHDSYLDFHVAVGDLMEDVMTANYDVFVAMDGPTNCRSQMKEANLSIPAVSDRCSYVEFFVHLCYTATDILGQTAG